MKKLLKKIVVCGFVIVSAILSSLVVTADTGDSINPNYAGFYYFSDMPSTNKYMYFDGSDAVMHCIMYYMGSGNVFLCATNNTSVALDNDYMQVTYSSATRTYSDGTYHSTISGPIILYTADIDAEIIFGGAVSEVTINYNSYPYVRN
ncbi:MAG: hypothetical protein IJ416_08645 [Ruminiclostridium sp.]|nr:hypothetical protein [Ruminiclostridium sp.]